MPRRYTARLAPLLAALCILVLAPGCLTFFSIIKLAPDGSGTIEETVQLGNMVSAMMMSMTADSTGQGELFPEAEIRERAEAMGEGVRFVERERLADRTGQGYRAVYAFDDINTITLNQNPSSRVPGDAEGPAADMAGSAADADTTAEEPSEPIRFAFTPGTPATLTVLLPQEEQADTAAAAPADAAPADSATDASQMAMLRGMLSDMTMRVALDVQGTIVETNATYRDSSRITFLELDMNELMQDQDAFRQFIDAEPGSMSTSQMKEAAEDTPGLRFEQQQEVTVRFR